MPELIVSSSADAEAVGLELDCKLRFLESASVDFLIVWGTLISS